MTTDQHRSSAALALIPLSVGMFGVSLAWAAANDPLQPSADPQLAELRQRVEQAREQVARLQAGRDTASPAAESAPAPAPRTHATTRASG